MAWADARWHVLLLAPYVLGSSLLGLLWPISWGGLDAFVGIWSASAIADAVFVTGSVAVGALTYAVALRRPWPAVALGAALTWLVYVASFSFLGGEYEATATEWGAARWVLTVGAGGIAFAALAPALLARSRRPA